MTLSAPRGAASGACTRHPSSRLLVSALCALAGLAAAGPARAQSPVLEEVVSGGSLLSTFVTTETDVTAVANHLYLATVTSKQFEPVTAVNGLGLLWTQVAEQCSGRRSGSKHSRSNTGVSVWMAQGGPSGNGPVSAQLMDVTKSAVITVVRYSGVDLAGPIGASVTANTNGVQGACEGGDDSAAYTGDLTATTNDPVIFGAVAIRQRTHTPGGSYTEIAEVHSGTLGATSGLATEHRTLALAGVVPVDGSMSNTMDWAVAGLEIVASPAGSCGDAICSGAETCLSCPGDCGTCPSCVDVDGDGYGALGSPACTNPGVDCNDGDSSTHPGAAEILCDSVDNNCNGLADDAADADADGSSVCSGDCNDADPTIFPGAPEVTCDAIDQNCNGPADDDPDADLDGVSVCSGDCDDSEPRAYPGHPEHCGDAIDNDCNQLVDCEEMVCSEHPVCLATPVPALPNLWTRLVLALAFLAVSGVLMRRRFPRDAPANCSPSPSAPKDF